MRVFLILLILLILPTKSIANDEYVKYKSFMFRQSQVYMIETNAHSLSVHSTLKGHKSGINCSYFNMSTRKTVAPGAFNRPFLVFKNGTFIITDDKTLIDSSTVSGGSWIIKNGVPYSTSDHFTKDFKNMLVRRTFVGIGKDNKIYLFTATKMNFFKMQKLAEKLQLDSCINLDGGTSTTMKYNGKYLVQSKRSPVNFIVID